MPQFWMVSNRNKQADGLGSDRAALSFWLADHGPLDVLSNWTKVTQSQFRTQLAAASDAFPLLASPALQESQKHVSIFVHGYNSDWADAARSYEKICGNIFHGADGLQTG